MDRVKDRLDQATEVLRVTSAFLTVAVVLMKVGRKVKN